MAEEQTQTSEQEPTAAAAPEATPKPEAAPAGDSAQTEPGKAQAPPTPPAEEEPRFSQREVDRFVARERRRLQARIDELETKNAPAPAQGEKPKKQEPQQAQQSSDLEKELSQIRERLDAEESRRIFAEAVSAADTKLNASQRKKLYTLYRTEKPEDPDEWLADTTKALGIGVAQTPTPQPQNGQAPAQAQTAQAPVIPTAPQVNPLASLENYTLNPKDLTSEHFARLGPKGVLEYTEKWFERNSG